MLSSALEYAITAERCGYDDAWITEHHFIPYGLCPSAATMAGFILGRTNRLRVGSAVSLLPLHHPIGTPEYCIECLATTMARTGLQHVMVVLETPADRQRSLENIERFSIEVLAKLRSCRVE